MSSGAVALEPAPNTTPLASSSGVRGDSLEDPQDEEEMFEELLENPHALVHRISSSLSLSEILQCKHCSKPYTKPRLLGCNHTFCSACIKELVIPLSSLTSPKSKAPVPSDSENTETALIAANKSAKDPSPVTLSPLVPSKEPVSTLLSSKADSSIIIHDELVPSGVTYTHGAKCSICSQISPIPISGTMEHLTVNRAIQDAIKLLNSAPDLKSSIFGSSAHSPLEDDSLEGSGGDSLEGDAADPKGTADSFSSIEKKCGNCEKPNVLLYCTNCEAYLCADCEDTTHKARIFSNHVLIPSEDAVRKQLAQQRSALVMCPVHNTESFRYYCLTCEQFLCRNCILLSGHLQHSYISVKSATSNANEKLQSFKTYAETAIPGIIKRQQQASHALLQLSKSRNECRNQVNSFFDAISQALEDRRKVLHNQLEKKAGMTLKKLLSYEKELTQAVTALQTLIKLGENVISQGSEMDKIRVALKIIPLLKQLQYRRKPKTNKVGSKNTKTTLDVDDEESSNDGDNTQFDDDDSDLDDIPTEEDIFNRQDNQKRKRVIRFHLGKLLGEKPMMVSESNVRVMLPDIEDFASDLKGIGSVLAIAEVEETAASRKVLPISRADIDSAVGRRGAATNINTGYNDVHDGGCTFDYLRRVIYSVYGNSSTGTLLYEEHLSGPGVGGGITHNIPHETHGAYPVFDGTRFVYLPEDSDKHSNATKMTRFDVLSKTMEALPVSPYAFKRYTRGTFCNGRFWHLSRNHNMLSFNPKDRSWTRHGVVAGNCAVLMDNSPTDPTLFYIFAGNKRIHVYDTSALTCTQVCNISYWNSSLGANAAACVIPRQGAVGKDHPFFAVFDRPAIYDPSTSAWVRINAWGKMPTKSDGGHVFYDYETGYLVYHARDYWYTLQLSNTPSQSFDAANAATAAPIRPKVRTRAPPRRRRLS